MTRRRRTATLLAGTALLALVAACTAEDGGSGEWTGGPTLAPSSGEPAASGAPAASGESAGSPGPSGSVPVGSGAPVASVGPGTSSAPQPSAAP